MTQMNRISKYQLNDRNIYEVQTSEIIYDIAFEEEADKYILELVKNPIIKIDIKGNIVRFYVDSDLISTIQYHQGIVRYIGYERNDIKNVIPTFLDLAIKKELYDLVQEYNVSDTKQIGLVVNGQIVQNIENYIYWPIELNDKIYDRSRINISREGINVIDLIKIVTQSYSKYVANKQQLTDEMVHILKENGLYDTFQDFLKQYK